MKKIGREIGRAKIKRCIIITVLSVLYGFCALFGFVACQNNTPAEQPAKTLRLDRTAYIMKVGESEQFNVITSLENPAIKWNSSDSTVASVSDTGMVSALSVGTSTISARVDGKTLSCELTVKDKQVMLFFTDENGFVEELALCKSSTGDFPVEKKIDIEVEVNFNTLENPVVWQSSHDAVATVSQDGIVTAVDRGEAVITASTVIDGKTYSNSFMVMVHPEYQVIALDPAFYDANNISMGILLDYVQDDTKIIDYVELNGVRLATSQYGFFNTEEGKNVLNIPAPLLANKGRYMVKVAEQKDANTSYLYECPFVYADYVISSIADLEAMESQRMSMGEEYYVLANDLDFAGGTYTSSPTNITKGTFDGYGHTISNVRISEKDDLRRWGILGLGGSFGATIKDLALINVSTDCPYGTPVGGTYTNAILENVLVMGYVVPREVNSMLVGTIAGTTSISNCVVIDHSNLGGKNKSALGRLSGATNAISIKNVVTVTDGYSITTSGTNVDNTSEWDGITQVKPSSATYDKELVAALKALNGIGNWTFDEDTKTLKLMGNPVYSIPKTVEAQFVEVNDEKTMTLDVADFGTIKSVALNGVGVNFTQTNGTIAFSCDTVGRHSVVVQTDAQAYRIPCVLANTVIRENADFVNAGIKKVSDYVVLANDLDFTGDTHWYNGGTAYYYGTWDGYGHTIANVKVKEVNGYSSLICASMTRKQSNIVGTIKDLAVVNATFEGSNGGLAGAPFSNGSFGNFENIFISATVAEGVTSDTSLLCSRMASSTTSTLTISIKNCVLIDLSNTGSCISRCANDDNPPPIIDVLNTVFVSKGSAFYYASGTPLTDSHEKVTYKDFIQLNPTVDGYLEELKKSLAAMHGTGNWTFENNVLKLMGNAIYSFAN